VSAIIIWQYFVLEGTEACPYYEASKRPRVEELIRASVHGHVFGTLHICPDNRDVCVLGAGVQHKGFECTINIRWVWLKCRGFLVLRVYNWGWITVRYTE